MSGRTGAGLTVLCQWCDTLFASRAQAPRHERKGKSGLHDDPDLLRHAALYLETHATR